MTPEQLLGLLSFSAGLIDQKTAVSAQELAKEFSFQKLKKQDIFVDNGIFL